MVSGTAIELKPRGVMELFDQAIRLYRNNFLKFVGIIAVAEVPIQFVQLIINVLIYRGAVNSPDSIYDPSAMAYQSIGSSLLTLVGFILSMIFVYGLARAALTRAIVDSYMGREVSIKSAYQGIKGSWGSLLGAMLLVLLLFIPLLIWTLIPCVGWFTGGGIMFFITLVVSPLIAPVIVIERSSAGDAIRRAWEIARRRFWWLIGFFMLLYLFNMLVVQGPVQIVAVAFQSYILQSASELNIASSTALQSISTSVMTLFLSLLYTPIATTCATLAYFDLRMRQEGFDLALIAGQEDNNPVDVMELAAQAPAMPQGSLVTKEELSYFVLLSFIAVALYIVFVAIIMAITFAFMGSMGGF